jgi:hypothetical protein
MIEVWLRMWILIEQDWDFEENVVDWKIFMD